MQQITKIIELYSDKIYGLCFSVLRDRENAEDARQNALFRIWEKIATFRGESKLSSWIYRVTINEAMMLRRRLKHHWGIESRGVQVDFGEAEGVPAGGADLDDIIAQKELQETVSGAFKRMMKNDVKYIKLRLDDGFSFGEIAAMEGITLPAAKSKVHRAKSRFRLAFDHEKRNTALMANIKRKWAA